MKTGKLNINWMGGMGNGLSSNISNGDGTYSIGFFNPWASGGTKAWPGTLSQPIASSTGYQYQTSNMVVNITKAKITGGYRAITQDGRIEAFTNLGSFSTFAAPAGCNNDSDKDIWTHLDYNAGTPVEAVLFTYVAGGTAYLGIRQTVAGVFNNTFYTFANAFSPHVGCVSVGNKSYITDGNFVRAYDPNTGTFNSINIGVGYTAKSVSDYGSYVAIVGDDGKQARMWLWDGSASNANFQYELRDETATAVINHGGVLRIFTKGKNNTVKIKSFEGGSFLGFPDIEIDGSIYIQFNIFNRMTNAPAHRQVCIYQNMVTWVTDTGYIWTFGSQKSDEFPTGVHTVGYISDNSSNINDINATSSGNCLKVLSGVDLWVSFKATNTNSYIGVANAGSFGFSALNPNWGITTKSYELPHRAAIKCIHVYFFNSFYYTATTNINTGFSLYLYRKLSGASPGQLLDEELLGTTSNGIQVPIATGINNQPLLYYPYKKSLPEMDLFYLKIEVTNPSLSVGFQPKVRKIVVEYNYEEGDI